MSPAEEEDMKRKAKSIENVAMAVGLLLTIFVIVVLVLISG